jgi:peroxiredoxin
VLEVGDTAPDFAVGGSSLHALAAQGDGAVVFFYPKAFTPG